MYRLVRNKKFQIIFAVLIILAIIELIILHLTLNNYGGYNFVHAEKYVTFEMPDSDTLTTSEWETIVSEAEITSYPRAQLYTEKKHIRSQYNKRIKEYGITYEEYLEESNLTEEEFETMIESLAEQNVKEKLILRAICKEKEITVASDEIAEAKYKIISDRGAIDERDYERLTGESIDDHAQDIDLESQLLYSKLVVSE